jgi:tRNA 2-thiouridine synthesizing protein D
MTDGPYISEYTEIAYKIAKAALKHYHVNIFLYLNAVHIPKVGGGRGPICWPMREKLLGE